MRGVFFLSLISCSMMLTYEKENYCSLLFLSISLLDSSSFSFTLFFTLYLSLSIPLFTVYLSLSLFIFLFHSLYLSFTLHLSLSLSISLFHSLYFSFTLYLPSLYLYIYPHPSHLLIFNLVFLIFLKN